LRQVAELNFHKAHYAANKISEIPGYDVEFDIPFFNEFVVRCPQPISEINTYLLENDILGGYDLSSNYPSLSNHMLLAVTEMNSREEIDLLVEVLSEVSND
jgi:glycine dehydrogenase subunit 1